MSNLSVYLGSVKFNKSYTLQRVSSEDSGRGKITSLCTISFRSLFKSLHSGGAKAYLSPNQCLSYLLQIIMGDKFESLTSPEEIRRNVIHLIINIYITTHVMFNQVLNSLATKCKYIYRDYVPPSTLLRAFTINSLIFTLYDL